MNSKRSFICALISALITIPVSFLMIKFAREHDTRMAGLMAALGCFAAVLSIIGVIFSIYGRKEKITGQKIVGFVWNAAISFLFLGGMVVSMF